ncbi:unnamed protein product [Peronospora destructor]|uniref:Uncharacterized protein n=1 Tax=Peronospora destructor TaxID=86335 RepID=A0AAV0V6H5_9STRA|nr:unnamed protein product [Peronospora destructor]
MTHVLVSVGDRSYALSETLRSAELAPILMMHGRRHVLLELGSGCGLAGLVAASLGADVLLTDQKEAIDLLHRNIETNATSESEQARLHVAEFVWGSDWTPPCSSYNYILVSDCINPIYGQESWRNLARSIDSADVLQSEHIKQQGKMSLFRITKLCT